MTTEYSLTVGTRDQAAEFVAGKIIKAAIDAHMYETHEDIQMMSHRAVKAIISCSQVHHLISCKCKVYRTKQRRPVRLDSTFVEFDDVFDLPDEEWELYKEFVYAFEGLLIELSPHEMYENLRKAEWDLFIDGMTIQVGDKQYVMMPDF